MGFGFAAFFFFVLITRATELDYNSERRASRHVRRPVSAALNAPCLCASTVRLVLSAVFGVLGGVILVMSWWRFGSVMACVVVVGLMLGFLVASVVLFTPLGRKLLVKYSRLTDNCFTNVAVSFCGLSSGDLDVFRRSDVVFWVTFCSVLLVVPLFFVRWPREVKGWRPGRCCHLVAECQH